jgi:hypothetical protein
MRGREATSSSSVRARLALVVLGCALLAALTAAVALGATSDTLGKTTVQQRIVPGNTINGYTFLKRGPGEPYVVRQEGVGTALPGRNLRRRSLVYFGQLSDFQLADEESPARVEFLDALADPAPIEAAWRPWEALNPQIDDAMIRQLNRFVSASPVKPGAGPRRRMDFTINTGDAADSQQRNETLWVRTLMEGGLLNPNSGISPDGYLHQLCPPGVPGGSEPASYTGVQDYNDYFEGPHPPFYDPNDPRGAFANWPKYPGSRIAPSSPSRPPACRCRPTSPSATTTAWCKATRRQIGPTRMSPPAASSRWRRSPTRGRWRPCSAR